MTPADDYAIAAQTLIAACRCAAIAALPAEARDRAEALIPGMPRRDITDLTDTGRSRLLRRGAALAGHLVHARLHQVGGDADDGGVAAAVWNALPHLNYRDTLSERLQAARVVAGVVSRGGAAEPALRDLTTYLSRTGADVSEVAAAAGHLCRRVVAGFEDFYRPFADLAWWSYYGDQVMVPDAITRAAAVSLVVVGEQKSRVAARAGVSRTTLDSWIRQHAEA